MMDGSMVTDFSIERILSPQLGLKPGQGKKEIPAGFSVDPTGSFRPPVPGPGCLQYRGMSCGDAFYPHGAGYYHTDFSSFYPATPAVYLHFSHQLSAEPQPLPGYHGYHQAAVSEQPQQRQRSRMRTVFTDSQMKQLETLFDITDYPSVEARAEVARSTGLGEETVRVWFKNRRARRKRSKVKSPSPPPSAGAEKKLFSSFL